MKHENLTIMFTDIKGFTSRTSRSSRKELHKLLDLHEELIEPIFEDFGGEVIKTIGDAFMVKFNSPTDAVLCGMQIQKVLKAYNRGKDKEERIEVRVAINSGECTIKGNDVFGEAVNIAARLEGIADAGDIYFTEAVYLAMNKNEIPTAEVGHRHFKGVPEEVKVYKVLREKRKGMFKKKDKAVVRAFKKGWWTRNWKWVALGVIIFFILASAADKKEKEAAAAGDELKDLGLHGTNEEELRQELITLGEDTLRDIRNGDGVEAYRKLERLEAISDHFANPPDMDEGIQQLWDRYEEKFSRR